VSRAVSEHAGPTRRHDVAVDIGGTSWLAGHWDGRLRILSKGLVSAQPATTLAEIGAVLATALADIGTAGGAGAATVGCSFAGAVDQGGRVEAWPCRPSWIGFPLRDTLTAVLAGPAAPTCGVSIEDDGFCAALGEARLGIARGRGDHLTLTLGTGLGGAWTVAGAVRRPVAAGARTIGHVRALDPGRACRCGSSGCLQTVLAEVPTRTGSGRPPRWPAAADRATDGWPAGRRFVEVISDLVRSAGIGTVVVTGGLSGLSWLAGFLRDGFRAEGVTCLIPRCGEHSSLLGATIRAA
jgi:predicted NBD/HSP70 family sugar kinase